MRFLYVMDPMTTVLPDKDTTFAFMRAAQTRKHTALHALPADVFAKDGELYARVREVTVSDTAPHVTFHGDFQTIKVADAQAVLIRKDPPFESQYLYLTLLLEKVRGRTVILNDPRGLRDANEKLYALNFPKFMPRTLVTARADEIASFVDAVGGGAVIKPLDGAGGSGVMMLRRGDKNFHAIVEALTLEGKRLAMVQEFLPAVDKGDKRILLLDGEILGAINRLAKADDLRSNIHVGGRVEPCVVTDEERAMVAAMAPKLRADGLIFVGLDVIGGRLTEVNVTSPTGIQELSRHEGKDRAADVILWLEKKAEELAPNLASFGG